VQASAFCIYYAMTWIRPMDKSRPSMKKKTIITMRSLMELRKPNNWKGTLVIG